MRIEEEIKRIEEEIRKTQYNKATEHHIGKLKAKLARLREELEKSKKPISRGEGIKKCGDASVAIIGPPFIGKSSLIKAITNVEDEASSYKPPKAVPSIMKYKGAEIQLIDLPGITKNSLTGKLKEAYQVLRWVDLIVILCESEQSEVVRDILEEIRALGVRAGEKKPDIEIVENTSSGGINIISTVELEIDDATIKKILKEFRIFNADIIIREKITIDQLIDFLSGNRIYVPYVVIKNTCTPEEFKEIIFNSLGLIRVFLKPPGKAADLDKPMILRRGDTIENLCKRLHKDFIKNFRYAQVWGKSVKFPGQRVGLSHKLEDEDIVTIVLKR